MPQTQFFLKVPVIPVATQISVPTLQTVQQTLSVQLQFLYGCHAPVVVRRQVPEMVQTMQITGGSAVAVLVGVCSFWLSSRCDTLAGMNQKDSQAV